MTETGSVQARFLRLMPVGSLSCAFRPLVWDDGQCLDRGRGLRPRRDQRLPLGWV